MPVAKPIQIAALTSAVSLSISKAHRYIVGYPVQPGAQGAVIEVQMGRGEIDFFDALIVLPATVPPPEEITHPVYSACMRVIGKDYQALLSRAKRDAKRGDHRFAGLPKKDWSDPPFSSPVQSQLRRDAYSLVRSLHTGNQALERVISELKLLAQWNPHEVQERVSMAVSPRHWLVLKSWERWESANWEWEDRHKDFARAVFIAKGQEEEEGGRESLRKRCEWLGLTKSKSPRKRRFEN
jgi:hypothetical protein